MSTLIYKNLLFIERTSAHMTYIFQNMNITFEDSSIPFQYKSNLDKIVFCFDRNIREDDKQEYLDPFFDLSIFRYENSNNKLNGIIKFYVDGANIKIYYIKFEDENIIKLNLITLKEYLIKTIYDHNLSDIQIDSAHFSVYWDPTTITDKIKNIAKYVGLYTENIYGIFKFTNTNIKDFYDNVVNLKVKDPEVNTNSIFSNQPFSSTLSQPSTFNTPFQSTTTSTQPTTSTFNMSFQSTSTPTTSTQPITSTFNTPFQSTSTSTQPTTSTFNTAFQSTPTTSTQPTASTFNTPFQNTSTSTTLTQPTASTFNTPFQNTSTSTTLTQPTASTFNTTFQSTPTSSPTTSTSNFSTPFQSTSTPAPTTSTFNKPFQSTLSQPTSTNSSTFSNSTNSPFGTFTNFSNGIGSGFSGFKYTNNFKK